MAESPEPVRPSRASAEVFAQKICAQGAGLASPQPSSSKFKLEARIVFFRTRYKLGDNVVQSLSTRFLD